MKRYPSAIMCTCVVPWDEQGRFIESLFVHQVQTLLKVTPHLYVFGTAGEGHAVSNAQFEQIADVFGRTMRAGGAEPMVGVVSLSLPTIQERIELCRSKLGIRHFQISLPSWGALTDDEVRTFFREVCGKFTDCKFLHYNLMRTKRLIAPDLYASLAETHPNFVATKNSTDSMERISALVQQCPTLQHFFGETGYVYGSQIGECGLLASVATNASAIQAFFAAGKNGDLPTLHKLNGEIHQLIQELIAAVGPEAHIDSAFDKMLWKFQDERFPLRLLPPYRGSTDEGFRKFAEAVRSRLPRWVP